MYICVHVHNTPHYFHTATAGGMSNASSLPESSSTCQCPLLKIDGFLLLGQHLLIPLSLLKDFLPFLLLLLLLHLLQESQSLLQLEQGHLS